MEEFKSYDSLTAVDERNLNWDVEDVSCGAWRSLSLLDVYSAVSVIMLDEVVPESIRSQFNVAKNLAVYSWYCYSFHQICEMKAYATVEYALKKRLEKNCSFRKLIKNSISLGLILDSGFSHLRKPIESGSVEYSKSLVDALPGLRNGLAHGGTALHPDSTMTLGVCADFINQLYSRGGNQGIQPSVV